MLGQGVWWLWYPRQQLTGWQQDKVGGSVDGEFGLKMVDTKPGVFMRWGRKGKIHVAYLSLLAGLWMVSERADSSPPPPTKQAKCSNSMIIKDIYEIIWWILPISYRYNYYASGKYSLSVLGGMWVSIIIYRKEYSESRGEMHFTNIHVWFDSADYRATCLLFCFFNVGK